MTAANLLDRPIGELVREDFRLAEVFNRWNLDFCCGGKRSLGESCLRAGINPEEVTVLAEDTLSRPSGRTLDPNSWPTGFLIDYIEQVHHRYVRRQLPALLNFSAKVAARHGQEHPYLRTVELEVKALGLELTSHLRKEEEILFPHIRHLAEAMSTGSPVIQPLFGSVANPIRMMESDHDDAGESLRQIRKLTDDLRPPESACTSWRVLYAMLDEFELDLHTHIHLENNVLFPRAQAMET